MGQIGVQFGRAPGATPAFQPDNALTELARQIKTGECILFLGAGVHAPPESAPQATIPRDAQLEAVRRALVENKNYSEALQLMFGFFCVEPPAELSGLKDAPSADKPSGAPGHAAAHDEAALSEPRPGYSYPPGIRPLLGGQLATKLAEECGFAGKLPHESPCDLQRVSLCFEKSRGLGRAKLVARLNEYLMTGKTPSPILDALAEMPFRIIVTTNYDRLMEAALRFHGKEPSVVIYDPSPDRPTPDDGPDPTQRNPLLFKMHGDLNQKESIVITDEDYITFVQRMSDKEVVYPVPMTIRYRMKKWSTLFVGYSLRDYNLRLLFRTLRWRVDPANFPPSFSIDRDPDPLILQVYENERQFITFVTQDLWSSVPYLYQEVTGKEFPPK